MVEHRHPTFVDGCFRCELSRDEARDADRTVHAWCDRYEVVRYDRAGKWYVEHKPGSYIPAAQVSLPLAVTFAMKAWYEEDGSVEIGRPGGKRFDALVRKAVASRGAAAKVALTHESEGT